MSVQISPEHLVRRIEDNVVSSDLGSETVMMDLESGDYFGLNEIASEIWRMLEQPVRVQDIIDKLVHDFDVSVERCTIDTLAYLQELTENGLAESVV